MRNWLRTLRLANRMSAGELAEKLHISESYYRAIEAGERQRNMDAALLGALGAALGKGVAELAALERAEGGGA